MNLKEKIKQTEEEIENLSKAFQENENKISEIRAQQENILRRVERLTGKVEAYKEIQE